MPESKSLPSYKQPGHVTAARCLREQKINILKTWERRARAELRPSSGDEPHQILLDQMPSFFDELVDSLEYNQPKLVQSPDIESPLGLKRSALRNYTLTRVLAEYHLLLQEIFNALDQHCSLSSHERNIILEYVNVERLTAAEEYTQQTIERERNHEQALSQREMEMRALANSIPQQVWISDEQGQSSWFNDQWYAYTGSRPEEVLGLRWLQLIHPDQRDGIKAKIRKTAELGIEWEYTYKLRGANGEWRWFLSRGVPIRDVRGTSARWVGTNTDITTQKQIEETLRSSSEEFAFLIDSLPAMAWTAEPMGNLEYLNQRFYQYTGEPPSDPSPQKILPYLHPEDRDSSLRAWKDGIESAQPFRFEFRWRRANDGSYRWHICNGVPYKNSEGKVLKWFGLTFDIDDQKHAQAQLEEERTLREHFINTLSHDLKNPLTAAKSAGELIARRPERQDLTPKLAKLVLDGLDRADKMIRDLLDISRIRAHKGLTAAVTHCDLTPFFREVENEFTMVHGKRFAFYLPDKMKGLWNKDDLRRALENLLSNAVKYGDPTTLITVVMKQEGEECVLRVHNFGPPIQPENQTKLFEPFTQIQNHRPDRPKGWGIGLAVVKGIIEAHQGNVSVQSAPEIGTTFTVRFPLKPNPEHRAA